MENVHFLKSPNQPFFLKLHYQTYLCKVSGVVQLHQNLLHVFVGSSMLRAGLYLSVAQVCSGPGHGSSSAERVSSVEEWCSRRGHETGGAGVLISELCGGVKCCWPDSFKISITSFSVAQCVPSNLVWIMFQLAKIFCLLKILLKTSKWQQTKGNCQRNGKEEEYT